MKKLLLIPLLSLLIIFGFALVPADEPQATPVIPTATRPDPPTEKWNYTPSPRVQTLRQDAEIAAVMQRLRLDYTGLELIYGRIPANINGLAAFTEPNKIYLRELGPLTDRMISHEYMHYIDTKYPAESQPFYAYMDELVATDPAFKERMSKYINGQVCSGNCLTLQQESLAIACTEVPDYALRADFIFYCNKHLPTRYSLL